MKRVTIKEIRNHFNEQGYTPKHSFAGLKYAANRLGKQLDVDNAFDVLLLVIENRPLVGWYTHSYGFHTRSGRELIETFQNYYYENTNRI